MTTAILGYDSRYEIYSGGSFVEIAEVTEINPGETEADRVEATHMQSPGRRREFIAGLIDTGEASFSLNWVPGGASDILLRTLLASGEITQHRITFPNAVTVTFDGAITGMSRSLPIDGRMTATVTVATSGDEVWA